MFYWLKIAIAAIVLSVAFVAVMGAIVVGFSHLPEPVQPWVLGGGLFVILVAATASGIHLWLRIR